MIFQEAWDALHKPLGGNKKGYKKGFKDGFDCREQEFIELTNALKECFSVIEPVLMGGYDRQLLIEKLKEKYKL